MQEDEERREESYGGSLDLFEAGLLGTVPLSRRRGETQALQLVSDAEVRDDLDSPDNLLQPRCCSPGHRCNIHSTLKYYGGGGYSFENALLYTNTVFQFLQGKGVFDNTLFLIFAVIGLVLITVCLTSGNYPSNRNIVGRLLSNFSCLAPYEQTALVPVSTNTAPRSNLTVNGVCYAILRVAIPSISVYRIMNSFLNRLFSLNSPVLIYIIVVIIAILSVPFALAFFDEGSGNQSMLDPDATFVEKRPQLLAITEDLELDRQEGFSRVVANPSLARFDTESNAELAIVVPSEVEEHDNVPAQRCRGAGCGGCISPKCLVQHLGSLGYALQNAALNFDIAIRYWTSWGWTDAQPAITGIVLAGVTSSITLQNYFSAHTLLGNYLPKFFRPANTPETPSAFDRFKDVIGKFNAWPATFGKVSIATVNFFGICNQIVGVWPATGLTILISPAGLLATAGLFSMKAPAKNVKPAEVEDKVELLPDDDDDFDFDSTPMPSRWSLVKHQ